MPKSIASTADVLIDGPTQGRILIIDDNVDAAEMFCMLLEVYGYTAVAAFNGNAGLALAPIFKPDLILCDLGMPFLSGYDVARAIRRDPTLSSVRLAAVTAWTDEKTRLAATAAGFDHHLAKPLNFEVLNTMLEFCLPRRR